MTKSIAYPVLAIAIMLLMADFVSISLFSHNDINLNIETPDLSKHCEQSFTDYPEDEIQLTEGLAEYYKSETLNDLFSFSNLYLLSNFHSEIWQPPEFL